MLTRFVIPAAGSAVRFGGVYKELLPISATDCGLTHAVKLAIRLGGCEPVIVTTDRKKGLHQSVIASHGLSAEFRVKECPEEGDMWGSVLSGIDDSVNGGLIMPDTVPIVDYAIDVRAAITFGCFLTNTPWRFSVLDVKDSKNPVILTKQNIASPMLAWGIVLWNRMASARLKSLPCHFDRAFETIMQESGFGWFMLGGYADLGTFQQYRNFLHESRSSHHFPQDVQILTDVHAAKL